ncbi:hypothetical protein PanWU01x14_273060 [Parasponia andersonii]|uniref:Uncharacterized protein n=1 Tax=Parasponia andersonii TaxID=3476 RepID=A0A2P5B444_PARAD|nr:hypothetical protein PanWU01x14_273060 [Parasponia andersonii]
MKGLRSWELTGAIKRALTVEIIQVSKMAIGFVKSIGSVSSNDLIARDINSFSRVCNAGSSHIIPNSENEMKWSYTLLRIALMHTKDEASSFDV